MKVTFQNIEWITIIRELDFLSRDALTKRFKRSSRGHWSRLIEESNELDSITVKYKFKTTISKRCYILFVIQVDVIRRRWMSASRLKKSKNERYNSLSHKDFRFEFAGEHYSRIYLIHEMTNDSDFRLFFNWSPLTRFCKNNEVTQTYGHRIYDPFER